MQSSYALHPFLTKHTSICQPKQWAICSCAFLSAVPQRCTELLDFALFWSSPTPSLDSSGKGTILIDFYWSVWSLPIWAKVPIIWVLNNHLLFLHYNNLLSITDSFFFLLQDQQAKLSPHRLAMDQLWVAYNCNLKIQTLIGHAKTET